MENWSTVRHTKLAVVGTLPNAHDTVNTVPDSRMEGDMVPSTIFGVIQR